MSQLEHLVPKEFSKTLWIFNGSTFGYQFDIDVVVFGFDHKFIQILQDVIIKYFCFPKVQFEKGVLFKGVQFLHNGALVDKGHLFRKIDMEQVLFAQIFLDEQIV